MQTTTIPLSKKKTMKSRQTALDNVSRYGIDKVNLMVVSILSRGRQHHNFMVMSPTRHHHKNMVVSCLFFTFLSFLI
ncbi:hypothetical protein D3C76_128100 [compost metagenome]